MPMQSVSRYLANPLAGVLAANMRSVSRLTTLAANGSLAVRSVSANVVVPAGVGEVLPPAITVAVVGLDATITNTGGAAASVDWGDGTTNASLTHTYATDGFYTIVASNVGGSSSAVAILPFVWLKRGVGLTGNPISQWDDASGNGRNAVQATGANQPALSSLDGEACPLFAGSQWLDAPFGSPLAQPYTILDCYALTNPAPAQVVSDGQGSDRAAHWVNVGSGVRVGGWAGGATDASNQIVDNTYPVDTQTRVYCLVFNGATSKIYQNGVFVQQNSIGTQSLGRLRVGAEGTAGVAPLNGRYREGMVVRGVPTAAQVTAACAYLAQGTSAPAGRGCFVLTGTDAGNAYTAMIPNGTIRGLVLYSHGYGEDGSTVREAVDKQAIITALINAGYAVAGSNQGGVTWGNQANQDALDSLRTYLIGLGYSFPKTVVFAQSMGGVGGLNLMLSKSYVKGWYGIYPACNLAYCFSGQGSATFTADIKAAYGIASDGSDYASKTAGFDPLLASTSGYATKRIRCTASYDDLIVSRANNADALNTLVSGIALEMNVVTSTGNHGDASNFIPSDVLAFVDRC